MRSDERMWLPILNGALGWRWMENLRGGMGHEPSIKSCFNRSIIKNIFSIVYPIKIV
jgi:hypothetical protein